MRSLIPFDGEEWIFGTTRMPLVFVPDDGVTDTMRCDVLVWITPSAIRSITGHPGAERAEAIEESLQTAMQRPLMGSPRRPSRVRVADPVDARILERLLGADTEVTIGPTSEIGTVMTELAEELPKLSKSDDPFRNLPEPTLAAAYRYAASFRRLRPWHRMRAHDERFFVVDAPAIDMKGAAIQILRGARLRGLSIYDSAERMREAWLQAEYASDECAREEDLWRVPAMHVTYRRGADEGRAMRRAVHARGLEVAGPDAYPVFLAFDDDGMTRFPHGWELQRAVACLGAMCGYAERFGAALRSPRDREHALEVEVETIQAPVSIRGPFRLELPSDAFGRWRLAYDAHPLRRRASAFLSWHGEIESPERLELDAMCFDVLVFRARRGRELGAWTPAMLDAYLFESNLFVYLGYKERKALPAILPKIAAWLAHEGEIDEDCRRAFVARLEERTAEFLANEERKMRRARWSRRMRGVTPLPSAPCPCGSEKRYRDCCA